MKRLATALLGATVASGAFGSAWEVFPDLHVAQTLATNAHNIRLAVTCGGVMSLITDITGRTTPEDARTLSDREVTIGLSIDGGEAIALPTRVAITHYQGQLLGLQNTQVPLEVVLALMQGREAVITNLAERYVFSLDGSDKALAGMACHRETRLL